MTCSVKEYKGSLQEVAVSDRGDEDDAEREERFANTDVLMSPLRLR